MSDERLFVEPEVARTVLDHALEAAPLECCGLLLGPAEDHASEAVRAPNVHDNPRTEYEVDPDALLEAVRRAEAGDEELVGFYHSHPRGPDAFSDTDRARGAWEGRTYLLLCLDPLAARAGRWDGERFRPVPVVAHEDRPALARDGARG